MKFWRILQLVMLVVVAGYLLLLHQLNPANVLMPFFLSMPPALLVVIALLLGYLYGFIPARLTLWRRNRELQGLKKRLSELESRVSSPTQVSNEVQPPVLPEPSSGDVAEGSISTSPEA